jgi:hypothetical protein
MDKVAIPTEDGWLELPPGQAFTDRDGRNCPADWLAKASPEEIEAIGGKTIIEPPGAPEGKMNVILADLADVAGHPARRFEVVDKPEPVAPPDPRIALKDAVTAKRDAIIDGGITFKGTVFQTRPTDRENIQGAFSLAFAATVTGGGAPKDLRWASADQDFGWIAEDNSVVLMDAPTVLDFGRAAAAFKQACTFYARGLKNAIDAAADPSVIDIEAGWPA